MSIKSTQIRLNEELYEKLRLISGKELRSLNAQMEYLLIKGVEQYEKENGTLNVSHLYEGTPKTEY